MDINLEMIAIIILVILGCRFPGLLIDVMKMDPQDGAYRDRRYTLGACFGGILFLLVMILN